MHYLVLEAPKADFKLLRELALAALKVQGSPKIFLRQGKRWAIYESIQLNLEIYLNLFDSRHFIWQ